MKSLGDILKYNNLSNPIIKGVRAAKVVEEAQKALEQEFGPGMSKYASPAFFKNDTLTIAFLNSAAAQELKLRETAYIERLNLLLNGIKVKKVIYMT
jgi:uncharacterized protein YqkB